MIARLSLLCLGCAIGLGAYVLLENWHFAKLSPVQKMQKLWVEDMEYMEESHALPPGWNSIREIELMPGSKESFDWLKQLRAPVAVKKDGKYKLQVLFYPWEEDGKLGAFLQYDLVDLASSNANTVWEFNRTLILADKNSLSAKILAGSKIDFQAEMHEAIQTFSGSDEDELKPEVPSTPPPKPAAKNAAPPPSSH